MTAELLISVTVAGAWRSHVNAVGRNLGEVDETVDQCLAHLAGADYADFRRF